MHDLYKRGKLVDIAPNRPIDIALYWHGWRVQSTRMERLSKTLVQAAREVLI
jgi:LysR family transcriptional regulator (chromosome initiation inhibitor)